MIRGIIAPPGAAPQPNPAQSPRLRHRGALRPAAGRPRLRGDRQPGAPRVTPAGPSDRRSLLATLHQRAGMLAIRIADAMRPPLSLGVRLVAFDDRNRVFLVRHSYLPGLHLPGGAVDADETCREAAVREAREEGGLDFATPPELFHIYRNGAGGRRDHVVMFVVRDARQARPERPSLAILAAGFHALDRLPDDLTLATRRRLDEVLAGGRPEDSW